MKTNKDIKGRAVFSQESQIRKKSLKLYSYLVCKAYLRNTPQRGVPNVRIFQQKDIVLSRIKEIFKMDERTIKKCWEGLETEGLIRFCPHTWKEEKFKEDAEGNFIKIPFNERWKIRRKHGESYYELPIDDEQLFRKIPKQTLVELNEVYNVNELTMKVYMTLINYQEMAYINNKHNKTFTYKDLRDLLGYALESATDVKLEASLHLLESLGLITIEMTHFKNTYGVNIPCFVLTEVDFYIHYKIKDFKTGDENTLTEDEKAEIRALNKKQYPEAF